MNERVNTVLEDLDAIDDILQCEGANYTETVNYAKDAVERMRLHPLAEVNKSATQGKCKCGRLLYREFKVCPMCERRPLWPDIPKEDNEEFCAACQIS